MALICPSCAAPELKIADAVELGRNNPYWDERTIQRGQCRACFSKFFCVYEELRSFRIDRDDTVSHTAMEARTKIWHLAGLVFHSPARKKSPQWRRRFAGWVMANGIVAGTSKPIRNAPLPKSEPEIDV